jgi:hypothetical protein
MAKNAISAVLACVFSSGCSWAFMTKPPEVVSAPNYPIDCTTSRAAPVVDTLCLSYFVINSVYLASVADCATASFGQTCYSQSTKTGGILLSAGLGLLCGLSAASGYASAARCEEKKDLNALCITGDVRACQRLRPGWVPAASGPSFGTMPPPPDTSGGCTKDTDCKGDRICVSGACVSPRPTPPKSKALECEKDSDCSAGICFDGVCRQ